jgi:hypothetical protein
MNGAYAANLAARVSSDNMQECIFFIGCLGNAATALQDMH